MKKNNIKVLFGFAVILMAAVFSMAGCSSDSDDPPPPPQSITYTGTSGNDTVTLTFTGHTTPTTGDSFTLKVGSKTATGTISVANGTITFTPKSGTQFTASSASGGVSISGASITFDGESTATTVSATTTEQKPPSGNALANTQWSQGGNTLSFTSTGYTVTIGSNSSAGTYTLNGTSFAIALGSNSASGTAVISGSNTLVITLNPQGSGLDGTWTKK